MISPLKNSLNRFLNLKFFSHLKIEGAKISQSKNGLAKKPIKTQIKCLFLKKTTHFMLKTID